MDTLPLFPIFRPIHLNDRDWYNAYAKDLNAYADFNFNTLYVWFNKTLELELSNCNDNVVIRYPDVLHGKKDIVYTLYGNRNIDTTLARIFQHQKENGISSIIQMAPEDVVSNIENKSFYIAEEDRDNSEYILDCKMIAELPGKMYSRKREDCNAFKNRYGDDISIESLDLTSHSNRELIYHQYISWLQNNALKNNDPEQNEKGVIESILANANELGYKNLSVFVQSELAAFVLWYYPAQSNFVIPSVIKSNYNFQDIFDFSVNEFAKEHIDKVQYINFEQDLGIEGLRKYKSSLNPISFLKKYKVSLKST